MKMRVLITVATALMAFAPLAHVAPAKTGASNIGSFTARSSMAPVGERSTNSEA